MWSDCDQLETYCSTVGYHTTVLNVPCCVVGSCMGPPGTTVQSVRCERSCLGRQYDGSPRHTRPHTCTSCRYDRESMMAQMGAEKGEDDDDDEGANPGPISGGEL